MRELIETAHRLSRDTGAGSGTMGYPDQDIDQNVEEPKWSKTDKRQRSQYMREFVPAMVGYAVVLVLVLTLVDPDSGGAKFWILLPILPLVGVGFAVYRSIKRADEYTRLLQMEAMAAGFGAAMFSSLVMGFLGIAMVSTTFAGWLIFGVGMTTWGITVGVRAFGD